MQCEALKVRTERVRYRSTPGGPRVLFQAVLRRWMVTLAFRGESVTVPVFWSMTPADTAAMLSTMVGS